jgi:hypothetical protein
MSYERKPAYQAWEAAIPEDIIRPRIFSNEEARLLYKRLEKEFNEQENTYSLSQLIKRACCCLRKKKN